MARLRTLAPRVLAGARPLAAAILLAAAGAAAPDRAGAAPGRLNIGVKIVGIGGVSGLVAQPGSLSGEINLVWTEPRRNATTGPYAYDMRVSTVGNINTHAEFLAAQPLTAFSGTPLPVPGPGGGQLAMVVTGLSPGVVHYFALREKDSLTGAGVWTRTSGWNQSNFAAARSPAGTPPDAVTDLDAAPGAGEGDVSLVWTAPKSPALAAIASYDVRYASYSVASVGGSTAAWYAAAAAAFSPALPPGARESRVIAGLHPGATWYFAVKSIDADGVVSPIDALAVSVQAASKPRNLAPALPSNLGGVAGLRKVLLSWSDLPPAGKGLDFAHYRLERSTDLATFVAVTTTTGTSYVDSPLKAYATYYYRLVARDEGANESAATSRAAAVPFTLRPMEPMGVAVGATALDVALSWSPTTRFDDGSVFFSTAIPDAEELIGYAIERSTSMCASSFVTVSSVPFGTTSLIHNTGGLNYYYRIVSYNSLGVSTNAVIVSALGERAFVTDQCDSMLTMDSDSAAALNGATNGLGVDVRVLQQQRVDDIGGNVFQSVEWKPMLDGRTELTSFALPKPARIVLRFEIQGGQVVPKGKGARAQAVLSAARPVAVSPKDVGMYWFNGGEYKKMYGKVDVADQTVSVESPNLGIYQIRAQRRSDGAVFDLSNVSNRVITPNGDGLNDLVIFGYDPGPNNAAVAGRIYDVTGAFVAEMTPGLVPNTLVWDGRMNGRTAASGVYVYKLSGDGKTFTGIVVVAK